MPFDYSNLCNAISKKYGTRYRFAQALRLSERSLSLKMNGKVDWKQGEIMKACQLLQINPDEVAKYFFALKVQH